MHRRSGMHDERSLVVEHAPALSQDADRIVQVLENHVGSHQVEEAFTERQEFSVGVHPVGLSAFQRGRPVDVHADISLFSEPLPHPEKLRAPRSASAAQVEPSATRREVVDQLVEDPLVPDDLAFFVRGVVQSGLSITREGMIVSSPIRTAVKRLLFTESPWNPKAILTRAVVAAVPEGPLHQLKKAYYARLVRHLPEDFLGRDSLIVKHLVSPGDQVVDIGGSIGYYTKFLSKLVGPLGRVYTFEPIPATFDFLANNVRKLGLENVELVNCAVSDRESRSTMVIPTYRWGVECFYDARMEADPVCDAYAPNEPSWRSVEVGTTTLDSFFGGRSARFSFIKCDANFHELACLRGGLGTLRNSMPALLIEVAYNPDDPATAGFQTFGLLHNEGYQPYWFDGKALHPRHQGERSQDYFFLTSAHIAALRAKGVAGLSRD